MALSKETMTKLLAKRYAISALSLFETAVAYPDLIPVLEPEAQYLRERIEEL